MQVTKSVDGTLVMVLMTVGEAIALRDQIGRHLEPNEGAMELKNGLDAAIPRRLTVVPGEKRGIKKEKKR